MNKLTVGSLFSGIGGLDLGFERTGFEIRWQVEINEYCRKVLAKHWRDVPKYKDVKDVGAHNLEQVDVIVGGFPCQDISQANTKEARGIDGGHSGLWAEFARLIGELRPNYAIMENVAALLYRGLGRVLGDLASLGYDAEWGVLTSCAFGASHTRQRVFILAYPTGTFGLDTYLWRQDGEAQNGRLVKEQWGTNRTLTSDGTKTDTRLAGQRLHRDGEPSVRRVVDGVSDQLDRLRALGNAVDPYVAEYVARCVKAHAEMMRSEAAA